MGLQPTMNWSTLIRPRKLDHDSDYNRHGEFVCEPLDRGFGDELGRALRHALLEDIPGTAVVGARAWQHLDRLLLDLETNGAVSAHAALWTATRALTSQSRAA